MTDGLTFKMQGLDHLLPRMEKFPPVVQRKLATRAVRKGATMIRDAARANAQAVDDPATPESIASNIVVQSASKLGRAAGGVAMRVGVLGGAKAPQSDREARKAERRRQRNGTPTLESLGEIAGAGKGNPGGGTFYWRFLEFGTKDLPPKPILRPAVASTEQKALSAIADELNKGLDRLEQEL